MQFALIGILTEGLSFAATAIMTLLINSRHAFYGLTFIERFRKMKAAGPYMIFSPYRRNVFHPVLRQKAG